MAGIIKRQILKHLSRFTKNLSPEQINLSTLRGEGQLTDLQLDEEALQNMLDLPTWLAITRVYCNRAAIRIQWTKLKTHPICLMLDKVEIEMKTCEDPRPPNGPSPIALAAGQSEYGFAEKVVEGMFIEVGCVSIKIESHTFRASLQLWQLQGYSVSPTWQKSDLRFTRLTHPQRGEVLTFKQVTWQTLRIEADASESYDDAPSTPLRLLTNGGQMNIALKRRTKDCLVLSSKLSFSLDELLWVLTDSQLRALLSYTKSLSEAVQKSVRQRKEIGVEQVPSPTAPPPWSVSPSHSSSSSIGQYFDKFDVKETSYHLLIARLEIHVCDECQTRGTVSGGAIQMTFRRIGLDYYPSHMAGQSCTHWNRFSSAMGTCEHWLQELAIERQAKEDLDNSLLGKMSSANYEQNGVKPSSTSLYLRSVLIRVDDMDIHQVSSSGQAPQRPPILSCHHVPRTCSAVHIQYIEYYRLPGDSLPVPPPALYIQLHGLLLYFAAQSILWLNFFTLDLSHHLQQFAAVSTTVKEGAREIRDVRLDGFNLKITFPVPSPSYSPPERPSSICGHLSSVTLTNTRQAPGSTLDLLQNTFRSFAAHADFHCPPGPLHPVFLSHVYPSSDPPSASLWSLHSPGFSFHFEGGVPKHQILLHPMPFTAWACLLLPEQKLQVMFSVEDIVQFQLNHYHYLTLLRFQEQLRALFEGLQKVDDSLTDIAMRISPPCPTTVSVGLLMPVVNISLLLPASTFRSSPMLPEEDSDRSSLIGTELEQSHMGGDRRSKSNPSNKNEILETSFGPEPGQETPEESSMEQGKPSQLCHPNNTEHVEEQDSLDNKAVAHDAVQPKDISVDLLLGKESARDTLLSTLGLTRETFSLGKERMQRYLSDSKHKNIEVSHNRTGSPLSRTQSLDTVSVDGLDLLSLDSETTENFILKLDADMAIIEEMVFTDQDDTSQSTEGPEPQQILTLALHNVSSVLRACGDDVSLTLQATDISCAQKSQDVNGSSTSTTGSPPRFILHFDLGPTAAYLSPLAVRNGFLKLRIQDFISEIPVSALTHIGPFFEDEQIPEVLPMIIQVRDSKIILRDDGPRVYPSPVLPEPVAFSVKNLKVQRQEDGVFYITEDGTASLDNTSDELPDSKEDLQRELLAARAKVEQQRKQEQLLLQEIWKYNPQFHL
ncbi:bridge-like lipid transfer protein family member 3A isoform X2 [Pseudophryne corroboree]|uniref:bridge-like lipid transfer protein family member 3A isoform X2 n=1 Tax=Pseudophryne corroboree TaxID=495146 RepID=UPI003081C2EE